jgi:hypothetical protein
MPKVKIINNESGTNQQVWFYCPGCKGHHAFTTKDPVFVPWTWNQNVEKPTFNPSLMCNRDQKDQCHSYVRDGKIQFLGDCFHELKNQTAEIPEIDW